MDQQPQTYQQTYQAHYAQHFAIWSAYLGKHPRMLAFLRGANKALTWVFYPAYGLLLIAIACTSSHALLSLIFVPAAGFAFVSWYRRKHNAPRPAAACNLVPLIKREGEGESFPSRHLFSAATIATLWLCRLPLVAVLLWVCAIGLGACRVFGGVHFVRDVVAGALLGLICGLISCALVMLF